MNDMEKIQEYIKDNELVNKYDLSEKVFELYQNDIIMVKIHLLIKIIWKHLSVEHIITK